MNQWMIENLSWIVPLTMMIMGWIIKSMVAKVHERVDIVEDDTKALKILREEDKSRQDRFETQIIKMLDEMKNDIKDLL